MNLNEDRKTIYSNIPRILQSLATDSLLALAIVSRLLGREFYRLRPDALLFCVPIYLIIIIAKIKWYFSSMDQRNHYAEQHAPKRIGKSKQKIFLNFEKNIYLLIYFITDIIATFELSAILATSVFNMNIMYVYTAFFPCSVFYALFIHFRYRETEFNERYKIFNRIMWNQEIKAPISTGVASTSTFFCLIASMAIFEVSPFAAVALSCLGIICFYQYIRENIFSMYGVYLFKFAISKLIDFNDLLTLQLKLFHLGAALPIITTCTYVSVNSLALLYSLAYLYSTERSDYIRKLYNGKEIDPYDANPAKAHP